MVELGKILTSYFVRLKRSDEKLKRIAILSVFLIICCGSLTFSDFIAAERVRAKDDEMTVVTSETTVPKKEKETTKVVSKKNETTTKVVVTTKAATTVEKTTAKPKPKPKPSYDINANIDGKYYSLSEFRYDGEYYDNSGYRYTWYPETRRPGKGLNIPGRYTNSEGYVCDGNGRICIASDDFPYGTIIKIPFGSGIGVVYDNGSGYGTLDIYVH